MTGPPQARQNQVFIASIWVRKENRNVNALQYGHVVGITPRPMVQSGGPTMLRMTDTVRSRAERAFLNE
jgi:hypothetical protein